MQDSRSFHGARSYCRDRYTDLSTVNSVVNNTEIVTLLASHMYDSYSVNGNRWLIPSLSYAWIGLSNSWEWSDGSDVQLLPLTLQSGDGDCVMVDQSSSSLLFQPCDNTHPFLCYQGESVLTVTAEPDPPGLIGLLFLCRCPNSSVAAQGEGSAESGLCRPERPRSARVHPAAGQRTHDTLFLLQSCSRAPPNCSFLHL